MKIILIKKNPSHLTTVNPVLLRGLGEGEHDVVVHLAVLAVLVLVHDLLDKVAGEGDQKRLKYFHRQWIPNTVSQLSAGLLPI